MFGQIVWLRSDNGNRSTVDYTIANSDWLDLKY